MLFCLSREDVRLYSERGILARGLAHPVVFMGQTTPRVLDGAVNGVVKQGEGRGKDVGDDDAPGGDTNGMQTFFTKVCPLCRCGRRYGQRDGETRDEEEGA